MLLESGKNLTLFKNTAEKFNKLKAAKNLSENGLMQNMK